MRNLCVSHEISGHRSEREEMKEGRPWRNFRVSFDDELDYSKTEPRFLDSELRASEVVTPESIDTTTREPRRSALRNRTRGRGKGSGRGRPKRSWPVLNE